jgi:hypothetical protein
MSNELKPCPFAKPGEVHHTRTITAVGESWVLCSCGASGPTFSGVDSERKAIEAWNTRAERTCKNRGSYKGCSECGWYLNDNDRYCGGCGAKVVE